MEIKEAYEVVEEEREGCWTPKRGECQIQAAAVCPPPPKKKRCWYGKGKIDPPKNGYFKPPDDFDFLFCVPPRHPACS